jgi:drug/metabolite transporter (DMT)-like permease
LIDPNQRNPALPLVLLAFAAVYVIWGSTYLAILFAVESLPPFLMAGFRFLGAGAVLLLFAALRRKSLAWPTRQELLSTVIIGGLLLLGGNGAVVWAELTTDSGLVALIVATVPLWMVVLDWLLFGGGRPGRRVAGGLALGLGGVALLIGKTSFEEGSAQGCLAVVGGSLSWALGSLLSRRLPLPRSGLMSTALQMAGGGVLLIVAGSATGEWARLDLASASSRSWIALAYLLVFGSLVAFSCYTWLLRVSTPARVGTYAYVNPVVAVTLGWLFAGEELSGRMLFASSIIVIAVFLITGARGPGPRIKKDPEPLPPLTASPRPTPSR